MAKESSRKFVARNGAPRVQIEYDDETRCPEREINFPFMMGMVPDLSGQLVEPLPPVADRRFLDIDNFDGRLRAMQPRASRRRSRTR